MTFKGYYRHPWRHSLLTTILVTAIGCSGNSGSGGNGRQQLIPAIEAVKSRFGSLPLSERLSGVVKARNQVEIYPEISAIVSAVHVQNGEEVSRSQALASLRDTEFKERLNQARAALQIAQAQARQAEARQKEANSELRRTRALAEKGLTNEAELETVETRSLSADADVELARARVDQAQANVSEMQDALSRTVIRAPVAGTVGNRNAEIGMTVGPSTKLFTLGQLDSVRVEVILTDRMLTYIQAGQRAEIASGMLNPGVITAQLSRVSPFLHPVTHSTEAEIDLANPEHELKSGMFVTVDIHYGESEQATLVPLSALYENPLTGGTGVYVCSDSTLQVPSEVAGSGKKGALSEPAAFEFVPVNVIAKGRMSAGVSGIDPDMWVVTIGQDLFGGDSGRARVRPVEWAWVEHLQNLQREDLIEEIVSERTKPTSDSSNPGI